MVVIYYFTVMLVGVVVDQIYCDFFYFLRFWLTQPSYDGLSFNITMPFIHQMAPLYFA